MKKVLMILVVGMVLAFFLGSTYAVEVFRTKTELIWYDKDKTCDGYVMHWPMKEKASKRNNYKDPLGKLYLTDMEGYVIQTWPGIANNPKLYPDGVVLNNDQLSSDPKQAYWASMDWEGNKTRLFPAQTGSDSRRIWNKKLRQYTYLDKIRDSDGYSKEEIVAKGGDPALSYGNVSGESINEYDRNGNIIWRWRFIDHVIQDRNPAWPNYVGKGKTIEDYPGKQNLFHKTDASAFRNRGEGIQRDWHHCNSLDYNEDLDLIAINSKNWSEFYVIDHGNTFVAGDLSASIALAASSKGDFLYRFGNPSAYQQGKPPGFGTEGDQQMYGAHNIQWIKPYAWERPHSEAGDTWPDPAEYKTDVALPGAGNFLIFDNGVYNPKLAHSEVLEINPYISGIERSTGEPIIGKVMVNPPDAGYKSNGDSNQIVWKYKSILPNSFFSQSQAGMNRLPNGNTHIHSANTGHMFQVTPAGEVVWEYINPVSSYDDTGHMIQTEWPAEYRGREFDEHRSVWYSPLHPAFQGKDMTRKGTITGRPPSPLGPLPGGITEY